MKKIAYAIIFVGLVFALAGCTWQIPEKVSVKTNAEYNFSLGNFEKDLSDKLSISGMLDDVNLPNNGKIYDYWPNKAGNTQRFLMYMPLMEVPIDISQYFDKGALADSIKNISFEKEIEVPAVDINYDLEIALSDVNKKICEEFRLAGIINHYDASTFSQIYSFADTLSFEKGTMVINAYNIGSYTPGASISDLITTIDTSYSGTVTLKSNGKEINGTFYNGVATLDLNGFDFKTSNIEIDFSNPSLTYSKAFIAVIDTTNESTRPYQIKSVEGLTLAQPITFDVNQNIDALSGLSDTVTGCEIGEGSLTLDFGLPSEWKNVNPAYRITLSGGIDLDSGNRTTTTNPVTLSLNNKTITTDAINAKVDFTLNIANATIDFTKKPSIGISSEIKKIATVTVALSDTSLSFNSQQDLPDEVLDVVKSIGLNQCGIKGTYTNTLPAGNDISMSVFSNFFDIHDSSNTSQGQAVAIEGNKTNGKIEVLSAPTTEARLITLSKTPAAGEFKAFDFNVDVTLPGGANDKITIVNVKPNEKYKLAINLEPVIDWEYVNISLASLPSQSDTMGTGFNPSSMLTSLKDVLGNDFVEKIEIPNCNLNLYLTKPTVSGESALNNLSFGSSSVSLFYGDKPSDNSTPHKLGEFTKAVLVNGTTVDGDEVQFVSAPNIVTEKGSDGKDFVVSNATANPSISVSMSDLLSRPSDIDENTFKDAQLCVDYNISLSGTSSEGLKITKNDLESSNSGSLGIFALIDLPVSFKVKNNGDTVKDYVYIDLSSMMGQSSGSSSSSSSSSSIDPEFQKIIDAINSLEVRYVTNALPIAASGLQIGVDLFSEGTINKYYDLKTDGSKDTIKFGYETVQKVKTSGTNINPNIKIRMPEDGSISLTRSKAVDMYIELGLKTDGKIPVKE